MGRIIIFTGKGGVGKSSLAAAHAVSSASEGRKTLLVSTDMAHNLGDMFQTDAGREIKTITDHLDILELDPDWLMQYEYPDLNRVLARLMGDKGIPESKSGDHFLMPGFENLFSLLKIRQLYLSEAYDRILVDCAPTGETLSLLKLPELLTWYMEKFFPVGRLMVRILSPVSRFRYKVTLPDRKAMDEIEELHARLVLLQDLLRDPAVSTVRLVCLPEKMVVEETKRNYMYLNLYGYQVDRVFINRILPDNTGNAFMDHWKEIQKPYIEELEHVFHNIPITRIPWYSGEIRGMGAVRKLSREVGNEDGLFDLPPEMDREIYIPEQDGFRLMIPLPGVEDMECRVRKFQLDLDIILNNYNRRIPLPNTLRNARISDVRMDQDMLVVIFH
ncbi:MAG: TRC40/GET3/ArsA family transport-energizing ATPase, partial [Eubacterium sp.]|nr:TRC40/GET3/ArsA family transport-energizing ATPase [Eubacterium sp.]